MAPAFSLLSAVYVVVVLAVCFVSLQRGVVSAITCAFYLAVQHLLLKRTTTRRSLAKLRRRIFEVALCGPVILYMAASVIHGFYFVTAAIIKAPVMFVYKFTEATSTSPEPSSADVSLALLQSTFKFSSLLDEVGNGGSFEDLIELIQRDSFSVVAVPTMLSLFIPGLVAYFLTTGYLSMLVRGQNGDLQLRRISVRVVLMYGLVGAVGLSIGRAMFSEMVFFLSKVTRSPPENQEAIASKAKNIFLQSLNHITDGTETFVIQAFVSLAIAGRDAFGDGSYVFSSLCGVWFWFVLKESVKIVISFLMQPVNVTVATFLSFVWEVMMICFLYTASRTRYNKLLMKEMRTPLP